MVLIIKPGLISTGILTSSLIVAVLLIMSISKLNLIFVGKSLFVMSILGLIASSIFLFADIILTLKALNFEVSNHIKR